MTSDDLPHQVLLLDLAHDAQLRARMEEARALLLPAPPAARPMLLGLLVSSWSGGHVYSGAVASGGHVYSGAVASGGHVYSGAVAGAAGGSGSTVGGMDVHGLAVSESIAWRREHLTNVRPLGSVL
jgi:hypothetical protein